MDLEASRIQAALVERGASLGSPLTILAETASTNDDARRAAMSGAPHGATFLADAQTAGRGRGGHTWHSPPGENLYLSIVLRPAVAPADIAPVTLAIGLAVARVVARSLVDPRPLVDTHAVARSLVDPRPLVDTHAVARSGGDERGSLAVVSAMLVAPSSTSTSSSAKAGLAAPPLDDASRVALKWPNDVFVDGRKIAGVLVEGQLRGDRVASLVAGIGLNVGARSFPGELCGRATSLALAGAADLDRSHIAAALIAELGHVVEVYEANHLAPLLAEIRALDALRGRVVEVAGRRGTALGIDDVGRLLVRDSKGSVHAISSGEALIADSDDRAPPCTPRPRDRS